MHLSLCPDKGALFGPHSFSSSPPQQDLRNTWSGVVLSQTDGPFPAGCCGDCLLTDMVGPFVGPLPLQSPPVAAAPRFPRDLHPPIPGPARYNQCARCHWMGPS